VPDGAAYGLRLASDRVWPGLHSAVGAGPRVVIEEASEAAVRGRLSASPIPGRTLATGDGPVALVSGAAEDLLLDGGPVGVFHLGADGTHLAYASEDPQRPAFVRMLLDTALGTAALRCGLDALHASAFTVDGRLVAIAGPTGAGKTSVAIAALRRGAALFTDDLLFLTADRDTVLGQPGPALLNVPAEIPGSGLGEVLGTIGDETWMVVDRPPVAPTPPALVVFLERRPGAGAPRALREDSPVPLIAHGLDSGSHPERRARRLALLGRLAQTAALVRLEAGTEVTPDALAGAVLELIP
jgi:hypothetical protein